MVTDVYDKAFLAQLDKLQISYGLVGETTFNMPRSGFYGALGID